jgi:SNF2 family DNA or RNA helicase
MGRCEEHGVVEDCNRSVVNFLAMTGTPILNRPDEIFAPLSIVNDQLFPYLHAFERDYCERYNGNKLKWKYGGESRLVAKIKEFYIRRTRADAGIILPPQTITVHELQLDKDTYPKQQKFLEKLEKHGRIEIAEGRISTMMSMLALITRLRQGTVWPGGVYITHEDPTTGEKWREHAGADYQESIKVDKAMELAEEFTENGERTLILSQFSEPIDQMVDRLNAQGIRAVAFYGGTSKSDRVENNREAIKANFDRVRRAESGDEVKWDVIVAHYKLASEGLNLTDVTQTIFMDEQWNPGMEQQAMERTMRMGQTEETGVHILRIKNSIDMWMASLIEEKRKIVDGFETEISFQQLAAMINDKPLSGEGDEDAA